MVSGAYGGSTRWKGCGLDGVGNKVKIIVNIKNWQGHIKVRDVDKKGTIDNMKIVWCYGGMKI